MHKQESKNRSNGKQDKEASKMKYLLIIFMLCVLSETVKQKTLTLCLYRCDNSEFYVETISIDNECDKHWVINVEDSNEENL